MSIGIVIILIITVVMLGYLYYDSQNQKVDNFEIIEQEEIIEQKEELINWNATEHLGWMFKNGTNENSDNLNFYFDKSKNSFLALTFNNTRIYLDQESINDGQNININGENYLVEYFKEDNN